MLPWAHAAFGYLIYHWYTARADTHTHPTGLSALLLVFGTQVPDIVDKLLAWTFDVLPLGRSLGHSVFTLLLICGLLYALFDGARETELFAFATGYTSPR